MKKAIYSILGLSLALTFSNCSRVNTVVPASDVALRQDYEVIYDKSNNTTATNSVFRETNASGKTVMLSGNASLMVNGSTPNYLPLLATYNWSFNGLSNVSFSLVNNSGQTITNTVSLNDTIGARFPAGQSTTFSKGGLNFNAEGAAFSATESIWVTITGTDNQGSQATGTKSFSSAAISFTRNDLLGFAPGAVNVTMKRQRTLSLQNSDGSAGGTRIISTQVQKAFMLTN